MADPRCKRRKQACPRKKNVDLENMPEDADVDHVEMRSPMSPHPPPSTCSEATTPGSKANPPPATTPASDPKPDEDGDGDHHHHHHQGMTNGVEHKRATSPPPPPPPHPQVNGISRRRPSGEDERIKEYLLRSDTAVIYPEPVGGSIKGSEPEALQPESHPDQPSKPEKAKVVSECVLLKCPHCEHTFTGPQAIHELKEHLGSAHKELPPPLPRTAAEPTLVCNKCNATFTCKENLAKHKLFHVSNGQGSALNSDDNAALRKFKCPECGKAFKFKHHLKEHIRIHSGEKPFACANCGKRFSHSGSYSSHMTSKKCLVVNLKVRKVDSRSPRGRGASQNNSFRPIIPKYGSNSNGGGNAGNGNSSSSGSTDLPLVPAGHMPSSERFPAFLAPGRPQFSPLPLSFHPLLTSSPHYLSLGAFPEVTHLLQHRLEKEGFSASEHPLQPELPQLPPPPSCLEKNEESMDMSQVPRGELNAVKKILEIVDATVSKQQQGHPSPQSSPKMRNGLLSELLSAAPQPIAKIPNSSDGRLSESRCRFCCRIFDSKIDLHQHERYICPLNSDIRGPKSILCDPHHEGSDGESSKESGEENRPRSSSSSVINGDSLQTLKAHYEANPRLKKSELFRLSRDLKCPRRAVQEWFHSQQHMSRDLPVNGEVPQSPPLLHQNPSTLTSVIPHYNGALPTNAASVVSPLHGLQNHLPVLDSPRDVSHVEFVQHSLDNDQPLDLSLKVKREDFPSRRSSPTSVETEALNLSQRSSRTASPPRENNYLVRYHHHQPSHVIDSEGGKNSPPLQIPGSHFQSSLLYKYMQTGGIPRAALSPQQQQQQRECSPFNPPFAALTPSSPDRSPSHAEPPRGLPSPDATSRVDNSSSPSGTTGSYGPQDEHVDGDPSSPTGVKKLRLWHQGEGDESTLEDSPGPEEDSSGGSGKIRKSWKLHKVESEEGMYACDQCDKMFSKQSSLARHKYEHSGQRPHKCDVCSKAFKHKHHLTEHKRLHSGEKPFQCNKCLKRFSHSGSYSQHMNHRYSYCKPYHE